jgi:hypothetical protein
VAENQVLKGEKCPEKRGFSPQAAENQELGKAKTPHRNGKSTTCVENPPGFDWPLVPPFFLSRFCAELSRRLVRRGCRSVGGSFAAKAGGKNLSGARRRQAVPGGPTASACRLRALTRRPTRMNHTSQASCDRLASVPSLKLQTGNFFRLSKSPSLRQRAKTPKPVWVTPPVHQPTPPIIRAFLSLSNFSIRISSVFLCVCALRFPFKRGQADECPQHKPSAKRLGVRPAHGALCRALTPKAAKDYCLGKNG